jgi:hypothetical protein
MQDQLTPKQIILQVGRELFPTRYNEKGKKIEFNLDEPFREEVYKNFWLYFTGAPGKFLDAEQTRYVPAGSFQWDQTKGILLMGTVGVGKSAVFKVNQKIFHSFQIVDAEQIEIDLKKYGEVVTLEMYGYNLKADLLINDIGSEQKEILIYKNSVSIIGAILKQRDKLRVEQGFRTHATTNLNKEELHQFYGDQVFDRFKQMFNIKAWKTKESLRA